MRKVKYIVIHCSAGYGDAEAIKKFWREQLGWKVVGYHYFITLSGSVQQLAPLSTVTNGVHGFNSTSVHISYQGGVNKQDYKIAEDTRTPAQKAAIISTIKNVLSELAKTQSIADVQILGHRDFSPDKNGNGVVDSWERIKSCPCFDAIPEYKHLLTNNKF
ncbi:N-acetylmuramoyl-L-alanine amidase [Chitinophaga sp. SYP-B3965]|uniref:N-acetylmuramoyl-L-alanine amidase n=1 Tax=Chitinophaga sp. SYP-B3965 TaxID=2663120 RepID=UPI001299DFEE|nr:N-acetylmuramoyl-L-alanine amidase [Chitinophaga sp. SYP-B3965]MRG45505.1 N-acetylmuramoyl-L-alanine amidase [Chitinophaga sp. SYP-B3965]